jgi:hypothetical protein
MAASDTLDKKTIEARFGAILRGAMHKPTQLKDNPAKVCFINLNH